MEPWRLESNPVRARLQVLQAGRSGRQGCSARAPAAGRGVRAERCLRGVLMRGLQRTCADRGGSRRARRQREGAVMLVVMLFLMIATASAAISVRSTQSELESAGQDRIAHQTRSSAEAAMMATL